MPTSVLVVDDEPSISDNISYALRTESMEVTVCPKLSDAREALQSLDNHFDIMVLDVSLPDGNGFDFCREVRSYSSIPILFLTARSDEIDRVVGLELGADDYVVKPFSPRELTARIRAIMRRIEELRVALSQPTHKPQIAATASRTEEGFCIDDEAKTIHFDETCLDLSRYEYRVLKLFIERPGRVFSREELMDFCWEEPESAMDRTVDTHIKKIRIKLRSIAPNREWIKTHRGMGYSFQPHHD